MVTTPTSVINPRVSAEMCPREYPSAATMSENSLIWATVRPARNDVRLR